jgi:uncharacterized protein (DUF488 family)
MARAEPLICTVGHSNRTLEAFVALLHEHGVTRVLDVRSVPRSRHNPQFNTDALPASLGPHAIGYTHLPGLGGLRRPRPDSPNVGWRNLSFRGYADYMQTRPFVEAVEHVETMANVERCALMCAEAVPWRCHRSLIADALLVRGVQVEDIIGAGPRKRRVLTPFARVHGKEVTYPVPSAPQLDG